MKNWAAPRVGVANVAMHLMLMVGGFAVAANAAPGAAAEQCYRLYALSDATRAVSPGVLIEASSSLPAHCRVRGVIDRVIQFEVNMPVEGWTGRFLFHAQGGLAGSLSDATSLVDDGFAMATTDTGHEGEDPAFYHDPNATLDFAFRANHLATVTAKEVIERFYGKAVEHSYLWGCSNGGRAALQEALLYPDDFDGIIAGAPAIDYGTGLLAYALETSRHQQRNPLDLDDVALLDANSKRACDLLDGLEDGVIGDPRQCPVERLDLDGLLCRDGQTAGCLTAGQIETARFLYTGVQDAEGNVVVPGLYPGAETGGDFQLWVTGPAGFINGTASDITTTVLDIIMQHAPRPIGAPTTEFDLATFDPATGLDELAKATVALNPPAPDFGRFMERGGKLIVYNGWHDHPCRAKVVEDFYEKALDLNGKEALDEFMRVFLVPGMVHCMGGPGAWAADYVAAIVEWVENDNAPDRILAHHPGNLSFLELYGAVASSGEIVNWHEAAMRVGETMKAEDRKFSRPLCPYPTWAKYNGTGNPDDAANFTCAEASPP